MKKMQKLCLCVHAHVCAHTPYAHWGMYNRLNQIKLPGVYQFQFPGFHIL